MIDEILTEIPKEEGAAAPPREALQELEDSKAIANAKFERMDTNYDIQAVSSELTDEMETAHKQNETKSTLLSFRNVDTMSTGQR